MELSEAIRTRHSVRRYLNRPIEAEKVAALREAIERINKTSPVRAELFTEEPEAFRANKPHYGSFAGCRNYFTLVGAAKDDKAAEAVGYYGEELVLLAQTLGLNTCWVALTYEKDKVPLSLAEGEKLYDVIALGYGENEGVPHRSKPLEKVAKISADTPAWFLAGMEAALLAPTAINQQRFFFEQVGERGVHAKALFGPCSKTDLGIVKYHFELGAGTKNFEWTE